jgi:hypothetical protein
MPPKKTIVRRRTVGRGELQNVLLSASSGLSNLMSLIPPQGLANIKQVFGFGRKRKRVRRT